MKKRILVAPLNWGLGHATRCIPIINALIRHEFEPVIACDGTALALLKKEFPTLESIELPSYNINYSNKGYLIKLKMIKDAPKLLKAIKSEKKAVESIVRTQAIDGIISDNRLGVYSKKVLSIYLTHQLHVLSGNTTWLSTKLHQKYIKQFNECWVPDFSGASNLSGKLGHLNIPNITLKYIGPLSRFESVKCDVIYDILILLSGPEPQRTQLEEKLLTLFKTYKGKVLFVKGVVEDKQTKTEIGAMTIYNFMTSKQLEKSLNESDLILSRSGYTTIMDVAKLGKKAFFIPTPGQFEQEYLAKRLTKQNLVPSCKQDEFTIEKLKEANKFEGLETMVNEIDYKRLFSVFRA